MGHFTLLLILRLSLSASKLTQPKDGVECSSSQNKKQFSHQSKTMIMAIEVVLGQAQDWLKTRTEWHYTDYQPIVWLFLA